MLSKFWWCNNQDEKVHWKSWDKMCFSKDNGGMEFWDIKIFNMALLAKQRWRLLQESNPLVAKIYQENYFKNSQILEVRLGHSPSHIWTSIWSVMELLREGLLWRVAVGNEKVSKSGTIDGCLNQQLSRYNPLKNSGYLFKS